MLEPCFALEKQASPALGRTAEREDFQGSEIWRKELVLLEILGPWQKRDQVRCRTNKFAKCASSLNCGPVSLVSTAAGRTWIITYG